MMEIISSLTKDLEKIKEDAQSVHSCLTEHTHSNGKHSVVCFSRTYVSVYCGLLVYLHIFSVLTCIFFYKL